MNTKIENLIEKGEYDNLLEQIQVYENVCNDADINTYKFINLCKKSSCYATIYSRCAL